MHLGCCQFISTRHEDTVVTCHNYNLLHLLPESQLLTCIVSRRVSSLQLSLGKYNRIMEKNLHIAQNTDGTTPPCTTYGNVDL